MTRFEITLNRLRTLARSPRLWSLALVAMPIVVAACNRSNGGGPGY